MLKPPPLTRHTSLGETLSLIKESLPVVSRIAVKLGIETLNPELGQFGALLCALSIESPSCGLSTRQDFLAETKLEQILEHVEKACTYPRRQGSKQYPTLKEIVAAKVSQMATSIQSTSISAESEENIKLSLQKYVSQSPEFKILLRFLDEVSIKNESGSTEESSPEVSEGKDTVPEYPPHVNQVLYRALCPHLCSCSCYNAKPHEARLRLKPQTDKEDQNLLRFEMLFSAPTADSSKHSIIEWKESKILVPSQSNDPGRRRGKPKKSISFRDEASAELPYTRTSSHENSERIDLGGFCRLLSLGETSMLSFTIKFQMLRRLQCLEVPQKKVEPKDGLSLFEVLKTRSMSRKEKCILAYTLANSVWQYYGSDWMNAPWTHHNIHLLEDESSHFQSSTKGSLSCRPYLVANFHSAYTDFSEYCDAENAMHQYPQVLALGILLIEIARGRPLTPTEIDGRSICYNYANINQYLMSAWRSIDDLGEIDFATYQESVKRCLDLDLFTEEPFISGLNLDNGLQMRRDTLYRKVVSPLKRLLEGVGWLSDVDTIRQEIVPQTAARLETPSLSAPSPLHGESHHALLAEKVNPILDARVIEQEAQLLGKRTKSTPESEWLKKVDFINLRMNEIGVISLQRKRSQIRIAILDTGCNMKDLEPIFTVSDQETHIRENWKDWAENSKEPEDNNGHGTAVAAVLLRIAPNAEMYIGRVSKSPESLQSSGENIAEVIIYAAEIWDVDIVSLSFGFPSETRSIRDAIRKAEIIKNDSIIFFAAAANDGANGDEMFPAYLDTVISIRGTEASGSFVPDLNPPSNRLHSESHLFGTLGKDVPWDWPDENTAKKMTGCSIAAPIAAGIAALILQYASSCSELNESKQKLIKSRRGMVQVFKRISVDQGNRRFYIAPGRFFTERQEDWLSVLLYVLRDFPPSL